MKPTSHDVADRRWIHVAIGSHAVADRRCVSRPWLSAFFPATSAVQVIRRWSEPGSRSWPAGLTGSSATCSWPGRHFRRRGNGQYEQGELAEEKCGHGVEVEVEVIHRDQVANQARARDQARSAGTTHAFFIPLRGAVRPPSCGSEYGRRRCGSRGDRPLPPLAYSPAAEPWSWVVARMKSRSACCAEATEVTYHTAGRPVLYSRP